MTQTATTAAAAAVVPELQRLKLQFPQYKTNSLLYVLRRHKFDAAAAQGTLLTSSNTRFWRDFHSCGQGLVGVGEIKPARRHPRVQPAPPAPTPVEAIEQALAREIVDAVLEAALEGTSARAVEPEPELNSEDAAEEKGDEGLGERGSAGQPVVSSGLGEALEAYRCGIKLAAEGRHSECIPLLEQCVEVFEIELPADSSHTVRAVSRLMAAYKADGSRAASAAAR